MRKWLPFVAAVGFALLLVRGSSLLGILPYIVDGTRLLSKLVAEVLLLALIIVGLAIPIYIGFKAHRGVQTLLGEPESVLVEIVSMTIGVLIFAISGTAIIQAIPITATQFQYVISN